jgi:hypothetical protein
MGRKPVQRELFIKIRLLHIGEERWCKKEAQPNNDDKKSDWKNVVRLVQQKYKNKSAAHTMFENNNNHPNRGASSTRPTECKRI